MSTSQISSSDRASKSGLQYLHHTRMSVVLCIFTAQCRPELARRKRFDRAQPPSEFAGRQTPLSVERAQKALCRGLPFLRVAFCAGGNQVAVRIAAPPDNRHDMIEAAHASGDPAHAIEAHAAFALMD